MTTQDDLQTITCDGQLMARRLADRLVQAWQEGDADTVRWLWKRLVSVERDAQKRLEGR